jgi:hypothetical protein
MKSIMFIVRSGSTIAARGCKYMQGPRCDFFSNEDAGLTLFTCSDEVLRDIGGCLKTLEMNKGMIGWDLEALEAATRLVEVGEPDSDDE